MRPATAGHEENKEKPNSYRCPTLSRLLDVGHRHSGHGKLEPMLENFFFISSPVKRPNKLERLPREY
jgi:hypothetical protein